MVQKRCVIIVLDILTCLTHELNCHELNLHKSLESVIESRKMLLKRITCPDLITLLRKWPKSLLRSFNWLIRVKKQLLCNPNG